MKVNIRPYRYDLIPIGRWEGAYERMRGSNGLYLLEEDYTWYDKIIMGFFDKLNDLVRPLNMWHCDRKRVEKVHVDDYDVWSADHTLALIIYPVLVRLKEKKHGSPCVDNEDVPEHLSSTVAPPKQNEWDTDDNHHARWDWVLDEMIWAFKQHMDPDCNDNQFHYNSDQIDMTFENDGSGKKVVKFNHQKDPTKPPYYIDEEGKKAHYERIANGRRLFAKYYQGLWD
jgi:hypothetical protein